ncbi:VWA domain-containing protein [Aggregatilineales bacterium SYSU G02658]
MTEFRLLWPLALILLLPIFWKLWSALRSDSLARLPVLQYSDTRLLAGISPTLRVRLRRLPAVMQWGAYGLIVIALARPQAGSEVIAQRFEGVDLVVAIDISGSMAKPFSHLTRLDAAKVVTENFALNRPNHRLGLVAFAEQAYLLAPPTLDRSLYRRILADVTYASALEVSNRTAIGMGISAAASLLTESPAPTRAILLLTDGVNNAGAVDPITSAQAARALGIRIFTVGIGTVGSDADFDEAALNQIAQQSTGRYFNARSIDELIAIYDTIDQMITDPRMIEARIQWQDQAYALIVLSLIVLGIGKTLERTLFQTIP